MGSRKNGVACTTARVIQKKNAISRRVAVNVRTVLLLLMVEIAKQLKTFIVDSTTDYSRSCCCNSNIAKKSNESKVKYSPLPGFSFSFACCSLPLSHQADGF